MYSLPSTSKMWEPSPRAMKRGVPPTPRKARTGEFTPPGMDSWARAKSASDCAMVHTRVSPRINLRKRKLIRISCSVVFTLRSRRFFRSR